MHTGALCPLADCIGWMQDPQNRIKGKWLRDNGGKSPCGYL